MICTTSYDQPCHAKQELSYCLSGQRCLLNLCDKKLRQKIKKREFNTHVLCLHVLLTKKVETSLYSMLCWVNMFSRWQQVFLAHQQHNWASVHERNSKKEVPKQKGSKDDSDCGGLVADLPPGISYAFPIATLPQKQFSIFSMLRVKLLEVKLFCKILAVCNLKRINF